MRCPSSPTGREREPPTQNPSVPHGRIWGHSRAAPARPEAAGGAGGAWRPHAGTNYSGISFRTDTRAHSTALPAGGRPSAPGPRASLVRRGRAAGRSAGAALGAGAPRNALRDSREGRAGAGRSGPSRGGPGVGPPTTARRRCGGTCRPPACRRTLRRSQRCESAGPRVGESGRDPRGAGGRTGGGGLPLRGGSGVWRPVEGAGRMTSCRRSAVNLGAAAAGAMWG